MKKIIIAIIFLSVWILTMLFLGRNIKPDYSSDYQDRQCQDFRDGKGCW